MLPVLPTPRAHAGAPFLSGGYPLQSQPFAHAGHSFFFLSLSSFQVIAHAAKLFSNEGEGWMALSLYPALARRVERWVREGATLVRWSKFVSAVQRQVS